MRQIVFRIQEAKVAELMDAFVGRIERVAGLMESSDEGETDRAGIVAVFRREGGKLQVLLGERKYDPAAGEWALPGGHVKEGETPEAGAKREVKEEVGLTVGDLTFYEKRKDGKVMVYLYSTVYTGKETPKAKDDETDGIKWADVESLPKAMVFDNGTLIPAMAKSADLTEAEQIDIRNFIRQQPIFQFKHTSHMGEQVFVEKSRMGEGPRPIGCVAQDPDRKWFIVSGKASRGVWRWWETDWTKGEIGGVRGSRFNDRGEAAMALWLSFKDAQNEGRAK